ncbi:MAG: hypothetical protein ACJ74Z_04545 [Bryobacteraceae bacterium]
MSKDSHFESGNASDAPGGVGERAHELGFARTDGLEFGEEVADVLLVAGGVFGGQQDGAAGETGFDSVEAGLGFAFGGLGAAGELGVGAVGGELGGGDGGGRI